MRVGNDRLHTAQFIPYANYQKYYYFKKILVKIIFLSHHTLTTLGQEFI